MNFSTPTAADLEALARSGIPPQIVEQAGIRRVNSVDGATLVGRRPGSSDYAGLIFPYTWPGEKGPREYRLRRDHPDIEYGADGKPKEVGKYLGPPGRGNMLYFAPGTTEAWLRDASLPIILTEGEKKGLAVSVLGWHGLGDAAERPRFLSIALSGVANWKGKIGTTEAFDGTRVNVRGPIPDWNRLVLRGRPVTIAFDTNVRDNPMVQSARWGLTQELRRRGALVHWFDWPATTPENVNGVDDLLGLWGPDRLLEVVERAQPATLTLGDQKSCERHFDAVAEGHYRLSLPSLGLTFEVDRLRRDRHELIGELSVGCALPGARTFDGVLSTADFNLSSARARTDRAKLLMDRAQTKNLDWTSLVEEFCQRVLQAERQGQPAVDLRDLPRKVREVDEIRIDGLVLPRRHPSILFGDGGTSKSYIALHIAGRLAMEGVRTGIFDWELTGEDHRERLERLFGLEMPQVFYARCEKALVHEIDRLRRIVRENDIEYIIYDSVVFACDGPPESAEVAGRYFRAVREIGCGSLHIAHISKGEDADKKPFGSVFWHNSARSTWFAKKADDSVDGSRLTVGLFNRKSNLLALAQPVGYRIIFTDDRTMFERTDVAHNQELAGQLSVRQRMFVALRNGAMDIARLAEEIEADAETVRRTQRRYRNLFTVLDNGRLALVERKAS